MDSHLAWPPLASGGPVSFSFAEPPKPQLRRSLRRQPLGSTSGNAESGLPPFSFASHGKPAALSTAALADAFDATPAEMAYEFGALRKQHELQKKRQEKIAKCFSAPFKAPARTPAYHVEMRRQRGERLRQQARQQWQGQQASNPAVAAPEQSLPAAEPSTMDLPSVWRFVPSQPSAASDARTGLGFVPFTTGGFEDHSPTSASASGPSVSKAPETASSASSSAKSATAPPTAARAASPKEEAKASSPFPETVFKSRPRSRTAATLPSHGRSATAGLGSFAIPTPVKAKKSSTASRSKSKRRVTSSRKSRAKTPARRRSARRTSRKSSPSAPTAPRRSARVSRQRTAAAASASAAESPARERSPVRRRVPASVAARAAVSRHRDQVRQDEADQKQMERIRTVIRGRLGDVDNLSTADIVERIEADIALHATSGGVGGGGGRAPTPKRRQSAARACTFKRRIRRLLLQYHPDKAAGRPLAERVRAEEYTKALNAAKENENNPFRGSSRVHVGSNPSAGGGGWGANSGRRGAFGSGRSYRGFPVF